jgi:transcriptional regulator with XRE-family HTH domain
METTLNQRLKIFAMHENLSQIEVAEILGVSRGAVSVMFNGHSQPRNSTLSPLFKKYPDLNRAWLMTGEGEMLHSQIKTTKREPRYASAASVEMLSNEIQTLRQMILQLMGKIENFHNCSLPVGKILPLLNEDGTYAGDLALTAIAA